MYHKILVPLDGSSFSERVLAYLPLIATPHETSIVLLRVLDPYLPYASTGFAGALEPIGSYSSQHAHTEADRYLKGIRGELRALGLQAKTVVAEGDVAGTICEIAEKHQVDLLAMTTHGRSGLSRWALGSVADHVVRTAQQPVFLVQAASALPQGGSLRNILVPLDGTALAEEALRPALTIAAAKKVPLFLMRAVDLKAGRGMDDSSENVELPASLRIHRVRAAELYLQQVQGQLQSNGFESTWAVVMDQPAPAILRVAETTPIDLIVMSTHGRSGLGRWVYGSVADQILRASACPVLFVRGKESVQPATASAEAFVEPLI